MDQIVLRWEWRTFGQEFRDAEPRFAALAAEKVQISDEIYLVAAAAGANVKIRDQLMDIKILEQVDANGLEQWRPVLKEPFPLAPAAITQVRAALGLPSVPVETDRLPLDRLLAGVAPAGGPVRVLTVKKTRARYHVHGCLAELTDLIADGKTVRTVAIEDADPGKVIAAVRAMGLDRYPNTSYPRGLKAIMGLSNQGAHQ